MEASTKVSSMVLTKQARRHISPLMMGLATAPPNNNISEFSAFYHSYAMNYYYNPFLP